LIAQLVPQLEQVLALLLVQVPQLELALVREQVLQPERVQVPQLVQEQEWLLASAQVPHPPHQQLQSQFQLQRSRLLQHEFLSTLQQLAKALQCQLCQ
jgi:hypothetical protein